MDTDEDDNVKSRHNPIFQLTDFEYRESKGRSDFQARLRSWMTL